MPVAGNAAQRLSEFCRPARRSCRALWPRHQPSAGVQLQDQGDQCRQLCGASSLRRIDVRLQNPRPVGGGSHGGRVPVRSPTRNAVAYAVALVGVVALGLRALPHRALSSYIQGSAGVYAANGELLRLTLATDDQYRLWTPLSQVSTEYLQALQL